MRSDPSRPAPPPSELDSELGQLSFLEMMLLLMAGVAALGGVLAKITDAAAAVRHWLLERKALVLDPLIELPGLPDAGLDLPRTLIAVGLLGLLLAAIIHIVGKRIRRG